MTTYIEHGAVTALRECTIIVPASATHESARDALLTRLISAFGGATVRDAFGYWRDARGETIGECVSEITFAVPLDTPTQSLTEIAADACVRFDQEAIYIRYPDGIVNVIDCATCEAILGSVIDTLSRATGESPATVLQMINDHCVS